MNAYTWELERLHDEHHGAALDTFTATIRPFIAVCNIYKLKAETDLSKHTPVGVVPYVSVRSSTSHPKHYFEER